MPLNNLGSFLPEGALHHVLHFLNSYQVHLTITKERKTVLGDYRSKREDKNHRITVNGNLNKYSFLITLLHEVAHLLTFEKYGHSIQPHGLQWKKEFSDILYVFIKENIFPGDVKKVLLRTLGNPSASSCADTNLLRVLRNYDQNNFEVLIENLEEGKMFSIKGGKIFVKGEQIRKRYKCKELATGKIYLFSPVYSVSPDIKN